MKRSVISFLISGVAVMLLAGCGGQGAPAAGTDSPAAGTGAPDKAVADQGDQGAAVEQAAEEAPGQAQEAQGTPAQTQEGAAAADTSVAAGPAIIYHEMETVEKGRFGYDNEKNPYARVKYPQIILPDKIKTDLPGLDVAVTDLNLEKKAYAYHQLSEKALYAAELIKELPSYLVYDSDMEICRLDEKVFAYVDREYDDMGGAHPNTVVKTGMYDPATGARLETEDVLEGNPGSDAVAAAILEGVYPEADPSYVFADEAKREMLGIIREELSFGTIKWVLSKKGLEFYFSPYELASYSLGTLRADFPYEGGALTVKADYIPAGGGLEDSVASYSDTDVVRIPVSELKRYSAMDENTLSDFVTIFERREEAMVDLSDAIVVENPGFDGYHCNVAKASGEKKIPKITEVSEDKSDWLNQDRWSSEMGIPLPSGFPYRQDSYFLDRAGDNNGVLIVRKGEDETIYDFSEFMDPNSRTESMFADFADMSITHAEIDGDVLYVSIAHRTYASSQPHTAFIVAVDVGSGRCLWKSEDQVSNSSNFLVKGDVIITGYGFTDEPDYMYILDKYTGEKLDSIKLYTGPDYFIPIDDTDMYVLTYNTEYVFRVENK